MSDKLQVWYCTKFDEIHLVVKFGWNKYMRATCVEFKDHDDWITITWPRPNRQGYPFIYLGAF